MIYGHLTKIRILTGGIMQRRTVWVSGCVCSEVTESDEAGRCHGNCVCGVRGSGVSLAADREMQTLYNVYAYTMSLLYCLQ